jgi:pyruvate/2-oxoglutarate dehydrogenase complex dihydrolipoamide acyltransferase (E2) component
MVEKTKMRVFEFTMPKLGHLMEEGTVAVWHKRAGDTLKKGELFLEVTTDKATVEVEAPCDGMLLDIRVGEGETAAVNTVLATIVRPAA